MRVFKPLLLGLAAALLCIGAAPAAESPATGLDLPPSVRFAGPGDHMADGEAARGAVIASAPLAFARTGVLTEDVTGRGYWVRGVLAPAGSPAIYLGAAAYSVTRGGRPVSGIPTPHGEFWCFLPKKAGGRRETLCLGVFPGASLIGPDNANPYLFHGWAPANGPPNMATKARIDDKPVDLGGEIRVEYVFSGWGRDDVVVNIRAGGLPAEPLRLSRGADGSALLRTPSGVLRITPTPGDPTRARVTQVTTGP
jgi:hypothetical protein